ncbi:MAG: aspartate carbamoyltransferase catalytic subunit [Phycisphaerales bacterium]|nr:aspartate carbamoyltransferase catalytic subunit [Phycisphaerales bacterium]
MSTNAPTRTAPVASGGTAAPADPNEILSRWNRRALLGLQDLSAEEIRTLLALASSFADVSERSVKKVPALRGRVVANLFFEDSTRTRLSFTLAAQRLSADVIDLTESGSSVSKGETIADTVRNVEAMGVDALVIRHKAAGAALVAAKAVKCAVINAGDGKHEHPTQGLLDIYTLIESRAHAKPADPFDLRGVRVAIVGDIVSSRVARSNIAGLTKLGAQVICVGPPTLAPRSLEALGCQIEHDLDAVLPHVDAINMLRIQFERHASAEEGRASHKSSSNAFPSLREYTQGFALTRERAARLKPSTIVMHPGPMNRGIEIAGDVADGEKSVIFRQVTNGLPVRMAALFACVSAEERGRTTI